jgi:hypothetical protein
MLLALNASNAAFPTLFAYDESRHVSGSSALQCVVRP